MAQALQWSCQVLCKLSFDVFVIFKEGVIAKNVPKQYYEEWGWVTSFHHIYVEAPLVLLSEQCVAVAVEVVRGGIVLYCEEEIDK